MMLYCPKFASVSAMTKWSSRRLCELLFGGALIARIDVPPSNAETSLTALSIAATRPALSFFKTQKEKMRGGV